MLLTIDVGNTNVVLGVMEGQTVLHRTRFVTDRSADYTQPVAQALCEFGSPVLEGAILGSVVPEVNASLIVAVKAATGLTTMVVTPAMDMGMELCIPQPETLAADIIAGCVGAMALYPLPLAVVDMGTATTVVVIDKDARYLGGVIVPGVVLSLDALVGGASLLPDLTLSAPPQVICGETVQAMCSGSVYGAAAMVDGLVERMEKELGEPLTAVITGGIGTIVAPHCQRKAAFVPDLLLHGLQRLYERNKGAAQ